MIQVLKLSRQKNSIQSSRADSRVKEWKFTSASGTDSVPEMMENFSLWRGCLPEKILLNVKEYTLPRANPYSLDWKSHYPYTNDDCNVKEESTLIR